MLSETKKDAIGNYYCARVQIKLTGHQLMAYQSHTVIRSMTIRSVGETEMQPIMVDRQFERIEI